MKSNIVIVGLNENFSNLVAQKLSSELDMYFANAQEIVTYNLINVDDIAKTCGAEYLAKLIAKVFSSICEYENSVISLPYHMFSQGENAKKLSQNATIIFLNLNKETFEKSLKSLSKEDASVQLLAFDTRRKFCQNHCDICIDSTSLSPSQNVKNIKIQLKKLFLQ